MYNPDKLYSSRATQFSKENKYDISSMYSQDYNFAYEIDMQPKTNSDITHVLLLAEHFLCSDYNTNIIDIVNKL